MEVDVVWQPYGVARSRHADPIASFRDSGVGGVDLRAKFNLWGNDTFDKPGSTALGLLPFVTLPTNKSNGISPEHVEGGLIVPFAINLPHNFGLGLNVGTVFLRDDGSSGYHTEYLTSASLSYSWNDKLGSRSERSRAIYEAIDSSQGVAGTPAARIWRGSDAIQIAPFQCA